MKNKLLRFIIPLLSILFIFLFWHNSALAANFTLSGNLSDGQGHYIGIAQIKVLNPINGFQVVGTTSNTVTGNYSVTINEGTYNVQVTPLYGTGFQSKTLTDVSVVADTLLNITLDPYPGSVVLTGRLLDPDNQPIPNAETSLQSSQGGAVYYTDSTGVYFLRVFPRNDYTFLINHSVVWTEPTLDIPSNFRIATSPLSLMQDITQDILIPTAHVNIHITDPYNNPYQNVYVSNTTRFPANFYIPNLGSFTGTSESAVTGNSDINGNTIMKVLPSGPNPGDYIITAYPQSGPYFDNRLLETDEIINGINFTIALSTMPTLYGRFISGNTGISNQAVELLQNDSVVTSVLTDNDGNYYRKAPAGNYKFQAKSNGKISGGPTSYSISGDLNLSISKQVSIALGGYNIGNVNVIVRDSNSPGTIVPSHVVATGSSVPLSIYNLSNVTGISNDEADVNSDGYARLYLFNTGYSGNGYTITVNPNDPNYLPTSISNYLLNGGQEVRVYVTANHPPAANAGGPYNVNEGNSISLNGSGTDPENDILTYSWDLDNEGIFETSGQNTTFSAVNLDGPDTKTVSLQVCDIHNACATSQANVNILNVAPNAQAITAPTDPIAINTSVSTSSNFTDPGIIDTHTAVWDWGDGNTSTGIISESNGSGSVSGTHIYNATGAYTITLIVTDKDGATGTSRFQYVVVYDPSPNAGFLTGSGGFDSQEGWYIQNPQISGRVKFGIQAKYNSENTLVGQTKFNFKNADLDFESISYQWLVVSGTKATLKGNGIINGTGNYTFLVTAIEGQDLIRVQIKDSSNNVIYDTQSGAVDTADPTTPLTYGLINVH